MKTAKVTKIGNIKPFDGKYGRTYFIQLTLDNGETGEIGAKKEDAYKVGDSLTYTSEEGQYGLKFKAAQQNGFGGGGGFAGRGAVQRGSSASFALSYSKDLAIAFLNKSDVPPDKMEAMADRIISNATKFQNWLKENE